MARKAGTGVSGGGIKIFGITQALAYLFKNPVSSGTDSRADSTTAFRTFEEHQTTMAASLVSREGMEKRNILKALVEDKDGKNLLHYLKIICNDAAGEKVFSLVEYEAETEALEAKIKEIKEGLAKGSESDAPRR